MHASIRQELSPTTPKVLLKQLLRFQRIMEYDIRYGGHIFGLNKFIEAEGETFRDKNE